jgi:hypothetical protein
MRRTFHIKMAGTEELKDQKTDKNKPMLCDNTCWDYECGFQDAPNST